MRKRNELLKRFKEMGLTYLDFDGYNEIDFHDNDETFELYESMFNEFIKPIFNKLSEMNFNNNHVVFSHFYSDEKGNIWADWYEPQIQTLLNVEDYNKEVEQSIKYITN